MKILVFGMTENPGGVESVIMNYYRKINKSLIQFDFLCNSDSVAYEQEILSLGGKIFHVTMRSKNIRKYKMDMTDFFSKRAKDYDAIWVNVCSLANIDYLKYAKKYGIKKRIIHSHNSQNMDSAIRGILHRLNKCFLRLYATDFWSCSKEAAKWFYSNRIIAGNKYHLIHNGIDLNLYTYDQEKRNYLRRLYRISDCFVVGNIARLHFQKNQSYLLDVFYEIKKLKPSAKLLLVGDGEDKKKLFDKVMSMHLEKSVDFLGVRNDIPDLLKIMDVFVFPSLFEGLPLALIESQASSLPTFISEGCISDEIKMTNHIFSISLKKEPAYWAKKIVSMHFDRSNLDISGIKENGYDINIEASKLERLFLEG